MPRYLREFTRDEIIDARETVWDAWVEDRTLTKDERKTVRAMLEAAWVAKFVASMVAPRLVANADDPEDVRREAEGIAEMADDADLQESIEMLPGPTRKRYEEAK